MSTQRIFNFDIPKDSYLELEKSGSNNNNSGDGLFRPTPKLKDKLYEAKIRFLPNVVRDNDSPSGVRVAENGNFVFKKRHYVNLGQEYGQYNGYYDCQHYNNNIEQIKCPLDISFELAKRASAGDPLAISLTKSIKVDRPSLRHYGYIYVMEDNHNPENVGKVLIWDFPKSIIEKLETFEKKNSTEDDRVVIADPLNGHDFDIVVKLTDNGPNFDSCSVLARSTPLTLVKDGKRLPLNKLPEDEIQEAFLKLMDTRPRPIEFYAAKQWTEEEFAKANFIYNFVNEKLNGKGGKSSFVAEVLQDDEDDDETFNGSLDDVDLQSNFTSNSSTKNKPKDSMEEFLY